MTAAASPALPAGDAPSGRDLAFLPAIEQARLVRRRQVSPIELVELYLQRIAALDPSLNAYVTVAGDQALEQARLATERAGDEATPPFWGVPVAVKDSFSTAGLRTTYGTAAWRERVPEADSHAVRRLRRAGFIVLGKTNLPELGRSVVTEPAAYGPCRNPWDPTVAPGGSSGGSAAAVAAGLAPLALGSDGGGSIRIPASACGLVGLKPSRARVSTTPQAPHVHSCPGPLARTVADAAAFLQVLAGYEAGDMAWLPDNDRPWVEEVGSPPGRLRVAVCTTSAWGHVPGPDQLAAVASVAGLLSDFGHEVVEAAPPWDPDLSTTSFKLRAAILVANDPPPDDQLEETTRLWAQMGRSLSAADYLQVLDRIQAAIRPVVEFFDDHDVLLTPTMAVYPPAVGTSGDAVTNPETADRLRAMTCFTMPFNDCGQPAMSLPVEHGPGGLPVGIQLVGVPAGEATLLRLAGQLEQALPWADRRPPIS